MTYRQAASQAQRQPPSIVRGPDEISVSKVWAIVVFSVFSLAGGCGARSFGAAFVGALIAAAWIVLDSNTRRFEMTIEGSDIVLRSKLFGLVTARTTRVDLAYNALFFDVGDEYDPPGFLLNYSRHHGSTSERPWAHFGSARDAAASEALLVQMRAMIDHARRREAALDVDREKDPSLGELAWAWPSIDVATVERNPWGRVRSARLSAPLEHPMAGTIGAGSTLHFTADDDYRTRAMRDELSVITFSNPTDTLYAIAGLHEPRRRSLPGAVLRFVPPAWIELEHAFESATLDGIEIDGRRRIQAGNRVVTACSTTAPLTAHGHTYCAGSEFAVNGEKEVVATTEGPIEHRGTRVAGRAHVHFLRAPGAERSSLGAMLAAPERMLTPPTRVHAI